MARKPSKNDTNYVLYSYVEINTGAAYYYIYMKYKVNRLVYSINDGMLKFWMVWCVDWKYWLIRLACIFCGVQSSKCIQLMLINNECIKHDENFIVNELINAIKKTSYNNNSNDEEPRLRRWKIKRRKTDAIGTHRACYTSAERTDRVK